MAAGDVHEFGSGEGRVTNLHRMTYAGFFEGLGPRARFQPVVVTTRELSGGFRIARKQFEKRFEALAVVFEIGRQLPEDRTKRPAETQNSRGEEIGERDVNIFQSLHVGDELR